MSENRCRGLFCRKETCAGKVRGQDMDRQPLTAIKGVGEKTARLFSKLNVTNVEELLYYYPRAYDAFREPQPIKSLVPETTAAVEGVLTKTADVVRFSHLQVTMVHLRDETGTVQLNWYNMPFLRSTLKAGERFVFRGKVAKKRGKRQRGRRTMASGLEMYLWRESADSMNTVWYSGIFTVNMKSII